MKNYADYENFDMFRTELIDELKALEFPIEANHVSLIKFKRPCLIQSIIVPVTGPSLRVMAEINGKVQEYNLYENGHLFFEILTEADYVIQEFQAAYYEAYITRQLEATRKARQEAEEKREAEIAAKKAAIEAEKLEKKKIAFEKHKEKMIQEFDSFARAFKPVNTADEFYYSLGWLTKHVGTVSAAMPDYLEHSFVKCFGPEAPKRLVDSTKVGPTGFTSQWTYSFTASLKKPENIPALLTSYLDATAKKIANTQFIWELVENYGFKFGKVQDVDAIRAKIPVSYIDKFEAGVNAGSVA